MDYPKEIYLWKPEYSAEWWYFTGIGVIREMGPANYHLAFFRKHSKTFNKHFWFAHYGVEIRDPRVIGKQNYFYFWREFELNDSRNTPDGCRVGKWGLSADRALLTTTLRNGDTLQHTAKKPPVWHNDSYCSITDLNVRGRIFNKDFYGRGWFDHSAFDASIQDLLNLKYTWIALQLDAGTEIMVQWSSRDPKFLGTICYPKGSYEGGSNLKIKADECDLIEESWGWTLVIPRHGLNVGLEKRVENRVSGNPEPGYIEGILDFPGGQGYFEIAEGNTKSLLRKSA